MSSPAFAEPTVEWVAPQSDMTKPVKPIWLRSAVVSVSGFSHAYTLLMRLYEHITAPAAPCWIAAWYWGRYSSCSVRSSMSDEFVVRLSPGCWPRSA